MAYRAMENLFTGGKGLIISPHQDDEATGMTIAIGRLPLEFYVAYLTDGAPLGGYPVQKNKSMPPFTNREDYRKARKNEAISAMKKLEIQPDHLIFMECTDSQLAFTLKYSEKILEQVIREIDPDYIFAPPYECAHPDHDSAVAIVRKLGNAGKIRKIPYWQYASYHNTGGKENLLTFATEGDADSLITANTDETITKKEVLGTYQSQQGGIISRFPCDREALRPGQDDDIIGTRLPITFGEQFFAFDPGQIDEAYAKIREYYPVG